MSQHHIVKEHLLHMLFGTIIFVMLGSLAVALDLFAQLTLKLGVSQFTHVAIEWTAHGMLALDLMLFLFYLVTQSYKLLKEMFK